MPDLSLSTAGGADQDRRDGVRPAVAAAPLVHVDSDAALAAAARRWLAAPAVALDTEFVRERTFFPRLGLIQVADGDAAYLLDPLAVRDLAPLAAVCQA